MPIHDSKFLSSRVYSGFCPDLGCQTKLLFPAYESSIECTTCGQRSEKKYLHHVEEVTDPNVLLHNMLRNVLLRKHTLKRGAEAVKVLGLSNTHCKLLSPILTKYGMEKRTGEARLLVDLKQGETFDCGLLGDRCFQISPEHIDVVGYGRDISGSSIYLLDSLATILAYNGNEERLLPIHADGDGHCLVHAISRALVGRELFWHPLRTNLQNQLNANLNKYQELFRDFINPSEWALIIEECDPEFQPRDGELLGLRNIHVFGLANVLRRPIILLDSLQGMQSCGDYAATFLPALIQPSDCRGKTGELNKPLCIAWSSSARNHYIPLVGISNRPMPRLPRAIVPKAWGLPHCYIEKYIDFDADDFCVIGGDKCLPDSYILKLVRSVEKIFFDQYKVDPALVADVHHYIYKRTGVVGIKPQDVIQETQKAVAEKRLFICLLCNGICEQNLVPESFKNGGTLYVLAEQKFGKLEPNKLYPFPLQGVLCTYDKEADELVPTGRETVIEKCTWCPSNHIRAINGDGSIQYKNGDRTKTRSQSNFCKCGYKHFWDGQEYDTLPQMIPIGVEWVGKSIKEEIPWFQYEINPSLNSNVYVVASGLVQKHFPGVFGSERPVQKVVDQILEQTKAPEEVKTVELVKSEEVEPSKIILSGIGTLHKEELNLSETERLVRRRIKENAPIYQRRRSCERTTSAERTPRKESAGHTNPVPTLRENVQTGSGSSTMVRIVLSDGRQLRLSLESVLTRSAFIGRLQEELNLVPGEIKKIMYGFPPKDLLSATNDDSLPFQSGDKVSVEIIDTSINDLPSALEESVASMDESPRHSEILQKLQDMQNSNMNNLDSATTSLVLAATLANRSIWSHVQTMPHLFTANGLFYNLIKRDVGLADNKHCRLPILPDKIFRYDAAHDRLELCLEPIGHFAVEPDVELKAHKLKSNTDYQRGVGPTGAINTLNFSEDLASVQPNLVNKNVSGKLSESYFHGQGYTLRSSSEVKFADSTDKTKEEKGNLQLRPGDEQMEMDIVEHLQVEEQTLNLTIRKGPGFSVLNPEVTNAYNSQVERLRYLASHLPPETFPDVEKEKEEGVEQDTLKENDGDDQSSSL